MKVIPKRTFLLRQDELENGKKKDVIAREGVKMDVSEKEAVQFFGYFEIEESDKKKLVLANRRPNSPVLRMV